MTTRDPRSRVPGQPSSQGQGRDPTQSLSIELADALESAHPSLALGTSDAAREEKTRVESPQARGKQPSHPGTSPPPIPATDDPEHRIGTKLGNYLVNELLGKGGMGYVYRAEHVKLGREVALKLLRGDYARRKDAVARFIQEARTVNRIRHRNIVDVPDILELEDGTTCIVMEFLRGQSLGAWARSGIELPRALAVLVQICDGLSAAHAVDIVHRDLKPDNVIVVPTSDGAELVKLLDFGVAKLLNRDDEDIGFQTAAGSVIGTPAYMSPEQAGGMVIDARSDIYSLGAIMYELFCGQPMFRGRSFGEYVRKHLTEQPVPPRATPNGANIDERLEAVILRCLQKDPEQRFGHILELRDALLHLLGGFDTHVPGLAALTASGVRPPPLPSPPAVPGHGQLPTPPPHAWPTGSPSLHSAPYSGHYSHFAPPLPAPLPPTPWWVWAGGGVVAVGLGISAALWYADGPEPAQPNARAQASQRSAAPTPRPPAVVAAQPSPAARPVPAPPAAVVDLAFQSEPRGAGVFAAGTLAELCRTPCEYRLDRADGGAPDHRTFVLKRDGYQDGELVVDLAGAQRTFDVTLAPLATATAVPAPTAKPTRSRPAARPSDKPADARARAAKPVATSVPAADADAPNPSARPAPGETTAPPTGDEPDAQRAKKGSRIDRTDTLDPFRPRRP